MTKEESLSKISKDLIIKEPFYGFFLIMLNKVWRKDLPTAGVSKNGINYQLAINEDFWNNLPDNHKVGLLKHELLHIAYFHLTKVFEFPDRKLANIAMDCEINQYIDPDYLPDGGINIDDYADLNLDRKAGTRYYYDALRQAKDDKDKNGTSGDENFDKLCDGIDGNQTTITISVNGGTDNKDVDLDNHGTWEEFENLPEAEQKLLEKQLGKILNDVAEQTQKSRGTVPGNISDWLIEIAQLEKPKFNWKAYLRRFTGASTKIFTKKLRRKENKRFSENPGLKIKQKQRMLLAIDTSRSVCDDELKEFMNEIHHIYKMGVDITIIQCDTTIRSIEEYTGDMKIEVHGRGGTEFDPVLDYFNANSKTYTSLVYFTDGECYADVKPRGKTLWVLSERSEMNYDLPGHVIKLEL
jgi:predicted metal-dependent peptidase